MPDFGLKKAIEEAVLQGAKGAKVVRPAEKEIAARAAEKAAADAAAKADVSALANGPPKTTETLTLKKKEPAKAPEVKDTTVKDPIEESAAPTEPAPVEPAPAEKSAPVEPTVSAADVPDSAPVPENTPTPAVDAIAQRMTKLKLGDYTLDATHMPNFDRIDTGDDIKAAIADLAEVDKTNIETARGPAMKVDDLQAIADNAGVQRSAVEATLARESGGVLTKEVIAGTRKFQVLSAMRIKDLGDKIALKQASEEEKLQFLRQIQLHRAVNEQFMGARAEWGRTGHAFSMPVAGNKAAADRIGELLTSAGTDVDRLAKAVSMVDTVEGLSEIAKGGILQRSGQAAMGFVNRVFVNGILSGIRTTSKNLQGNAIFMAMNTMEIATAARLGKFLPGEEHVQIGEALATIHGNLSGVRDAWAAAAKTARTGKTLDDVLRYDVIDKDTLHYLPELDKPYIGRVISAIDTVIDAPTKRFLAAQDEFYKVLAYRGYVERQALLHVQDQISSGKLAIEDASAAAKDFMENAPGETQQAAEAWAREMTFQTPLGPTGQAVQAALRKIPVGTLIAPFIRAPTNMFKESVYRSPMAVFAPKFWSEVAKGGASRDLALTRFAMGTGTAAAVALMVADDNMTGSGPQDPKAAALWAADGRKPYSIRNPATGEWHSYAFLEPAATTMGAIADIAEISAFLNEDVETNKSEDSLAWQASGLVIAGIINNTGNKTYMQGVSDFMAFYHNPGKEVEGYTKKLATSLVPYSGLQKSIRDIQDPYFREAWTMMEKMRNSTPGYSKDLPLAYDIFGEPRLKNRGLLLGTMSVIPQSGTKYDDVVDELKSVMQLSRKVPITMPDKYIDNKYGSMKLTAEEYSQLTELSRQTVRIEGKSFYDALSTRIRSSEYQRATPLVRAALLEHTQNAYDKAGHAELQKINPEFALRYHEWQLNAARLKHPQ